MCSLSFAYPDYCMCAGLRPWLCLKRHYRGYDINCQYTINLPERLSEINEKFHDLPTMSSESSDLLFELIDEYNLLYESIHPLDLCSKMLTRYGHLVVSYPTTLPSPLSA